MQDQTAGSYRTDGVPDLRRPARPTRLSLPLWLLLTAGFWTAGLFVALAGNVRVANVLQATSGVFTLTFVYWMWTALPLPSRRTSPLAAALCLLIPFYNIYWIFQAFWGYAMDFNRFTGGLGSPDRPGIRKLRPLLGTLFCFFYMGQIARVISPVLGLLVSLGWLVTLILFVTAVCRSVNSLADFVSRNVTPGTPVSGEPQPGRIPVSPKSPRNWPPMLIGALIVLLVAAGGVLMYSQKASRGAARNEAGLNSPAWKDVSPPGGRFTVQMPGDPTDSSGTCITALGPVEIHRWVLQLKGNSAYGVSYVDMPLATLGGLDLGKILDSSCVNMVSDMGGRLLSLEVIPICGNPGRQVTAKIPVAGIPEGLRMTTRECIVGKRMYCVSATSTADRMFSEDIERFLHSFRPLP